MNPHFFAYGSLPIYIIYLLGVFVNIFRLPHTNLLFVSLEQAIIVGRVISALFSTSIIVLLYLIGTKIVNRNIGILAAVLGTCSIGFIQFAHFATFEMWLTFFSLLLTYISFYYIFSPTKKNLFLIGIILGVLVSIKISSLALFLPIFLVIYIGNSIHNKTILKKFYDSFVALFFIFCFSSFVFFITNPFVVFDTDEFLASMHYETAVATGNLPVFYTQGFINSIPVLYQFRYNYPFLLNHICELLFILSFCYSAWKVYHQKEKKLFILLTFFLTLFLSQAIFFVKWTRYLLPTLPFIYILISYTVFDLFHTAYKRNAKTLQNVIKIVTIGTIVLSFFYAITFLYFDYMQQDTRLQAYEWGKIHIPKKSHILSEVYDLGIIPFNDTFSNITLFNFYDLETNPQLITDLTFKLQNTDYIILPSQRIAKNRLLQPNYFPKGYSFYTALFYDKSRYKQVYQTPCNALCRIIYNGNPAINLEETASVFDRPTVYIFKKL
jgi:hypothetical protein